MLDTVSYGMLHIDRVTKASSRVQQHGVQVGRFAVRQGNPGDSIMVASDPVRMRRFAVDHMASGVQAGHFDDFRDAMIFADDISRFSAQDPDGTDPAAVVAQLGPAVYEWLQACNSGGIAIPFRRWQGRDFDRELARERGL